MNPILNERIKLGATLLNTMAGSRFTVGVATPFAGYLYNVSGFRAVLGIPELALGMVGFPSRGGGPTLRSALCPRRAEALSEYAILAFVITPLTAVAFGWALALWIRRQADRSQTPAE